MDTILKSSMLFSCSGCTYEFRLHCGNDEFQMAEKQGSKLELVCNLHPSCLISSVDLDSYLGLELHDW